MVGLDALTIQESYVALDWILRNMHAGKSLSRCRGTRKAFDALLHANQSRFYLQHAQSIYGKDLQVGIEVSSPIHLHRARFNSIIVSLLSPRS